MLNLLSILFGLVSLVIVIPATIPLLGWANWLALPLIAVGGGAFLVPDDIPGITDVVKPANSGVANAVGAALAQHFATTQPAATNR